MVWCHIGEQPSYFCPPKWLYHHGIAMVWHHMQDLFDYCCCVFQLILVTCPWLMYICTCIAFINLFAFQYQMSEEERLERDEMMLKVHITVISSNPDSNSVSCKLGFGICSKFSFDGNDRSQTLSVIHTRVQFPPLFAAILWAVCVYLQVGM